MGNGRFTAMIMGWWPLTCSMLLVMVIGGEARVVYAGNGAMIPTEESLTRLPGLSAPVRVEFDQYGVPTISAPNRLDAMRALGFITARDRLFQMDWLRRASKGTLAEIVGRAAVDVDISQRILGMSGMAREIRTRLPGDQRLVLEAYAEGVNAFMEQSADLPFEFHLLGYAPDMWTVEDTILVTLGVFPPPSWMEEHERMVTVMKETLPADVFQFLTWDIAPYTSALLRERPDVVVPEGPPAIPVASLEALHTASLPHHAAHTPWREQAVRAQGSNGWVLAASKTKDGRAILANDMHLPVTVPNIWYRIRLRYGLSEVNGVVLPGIPVPIVGTNGRIAWGITDPGADLVDLVSLESSEEHPDAYRTSEGWKTYEVRREIIAIKNEADVSLNVRLTQWGPVSPRPLMGKPVAIRWVPMNPEAVDFGLLHMDTAQTMEEAIAVINRSRGPASNVVLADDQGHIAWTMMGNIPVRKGLTGFYSTSWVDPSVGWEGFIPPQELPRIVNPPSGFLVSANHRMVGSEYPYIIGHDFDHGYRAYRISEALRDITHATETDMLDLQLDTVAEFYRYYHELALETLSRHPQLSIKTYGEIHQSLKGWDGRADRDSMGIGILVQFRHLLEERVFSPFIQSCLEQDKDFSYRVGDIETPLRQLLSAKIPALVPDPDRYPTWDEFILSTLADSAQWVAKQEEALSLPDITWGRLNHPPVPHVLSQIVPGLSAFLDLPQEAMPGCRQCVRMTSGSVGASERIVVSPGHPDEGIFEMPGGQSGDPLSRHYRDQHRAWVDGLPSPFVPGQARHILSLLPSTEP